MSLSQIKEVKDRFKSVRREVKDAFDDVQQRVEKRRQQVNDQVAAGEEAAMTSLTRMDKARAAMTSHAGTVEQLVASCPDDALLEMMSKLTSRLKDLQLQTATSAKMGTVVDVTFESRKLQHLRSAIAKLGRYLIVC